MSITLLTAVPGGGKTSYAVWNVIKKAHEEGKVIYTCGIPKLKIPTIELTYDQIRQWNQIENNQNNLPELVNLEHGSLIVIDEVQKLWPAIGSKVSDDIKDLSVHRHYGLSFFLITQSPNLIHRNVLALVDRHLHIRVTWAGRKIFEWPEYCRTPGAKSSRNSAIPHNYTLPKNSFSLYHSSTHHIKPEKSIPTAFYIFVIGFIATAILSFTAYERVMAKGKPSEPLEIAQETPPKPPEPESFKPIEQPVQQVTYIAEPQHDTQLLTRSIDWTTVSACLSNKSGCVCYGLAAERLVVPKETCELAVKHGWNKLAKKL